MTSTGDKGFVNFQGTDYVVSDQVFKQFKAGYEQAQKQSQRATRTSRSRSLGIDPRKWLTDPKNEGDAKVGDDDTIKITGGVDVDKLLDDVNNALDEGARRSASRAPQQLPEQAHRPSRSKQVADAIKDPKVEIYTGKEDKILRRMVVDARHRRRPRAPRGSADVKFDLSISDLNEDQEIAEPSGRQAVRPSCSASSAGSASAAWAAPARAAAAARPAAARRGSRVERRSSRSTPSASPTPAATSTRRASAPSC